MRVVSARPYVYICYYCCLNMFQRVLFIKWNFLRFRYFLCFKCPYIYINMADAADASILSYTHRESNWICNRMARGRSVYIGKYRVYRACGRLEYRGWLPTYFYCMIKKSGFVVAREKAFFNIGRCRRLPARTKQIKRLFIIVIIYNVYKRGPA